MYSKVVVPLDGSELSERSLPYARMVAGALSIPIELVEAFDVLPPALHDHLAVAAMQRMLDQARSRTDDYLSRMRTSLREMGFTPRPQRRCRAVRCRPSWIGSRTILTRWW